MGQVDINAANSVLKRIFENRKAVRQFESAAPYTKSRKKKPQKFGAGLYGGIQLSDIQAIGIRNSGSGNDNEDMPTPTSPDWDQPTFDAVRTYGRINISGKAASRAFSGDDLQSFMGDVGDLTASITRAMMRDEDFRAFNTSTATGSKTGCRGVLNNADYASSASAQTFTLDTSTNATTRRYKMLQGIARGMNLDVYSKTTWTKVASIVVTATQEDASTFSGILDITLAGTSNEFYLFREGDFNRDISGLGDIIDDGTYTSTYGGVTTGGQWQGMVLSNSGTLRDFSADLMNQAFLKLQKRNEEDQQMESWMTYGMKQELLGFVQRTIISNKPMGNSPMKVNVGGDVEQWGPNFNYKVSPRMLAHSIYFINPSLIEYEEQEPFGPVRLDGTKGSDRFFQRIPGKDNWEALMVHEFQQKTLERNKTLKMEDLNQNAY